MQTTEEYQEIQQKSSKGIKWQGIAEIFIRIFQFTTTIILARLLLPQDFGIISVALIFIQLAYVLFDFGFSSALIQKKEITDDHYSVTFFVYLISATFFTLLVFIFSPFIAAYFKQEILQSILNTLALIFYFFALSAIPRIRLIKEMRFKRLSTLQIVSVFAYGLVTILFAWQGAGVWSFVYGSLTEQFVLTILLNLFAWWRPRLNFQWTIFKEMASFGGNVLGTRIVGYINLNSPNFIIGRILGATQLGYYSIAYQLVEFPVQRISKNILRVMFPAFSKIQDDLDAFRTLYKQTVYHLALVTFPIFTGIVLIAPQFVRLFYGEKWIPAIIPLQILTAAGLLRSLWTTTSVVFLSKGRPNIEFKINLTYSLFLIPGIFLASYFGIASVAATIAGIMFIFLLVAQISAMKIIKMPMGELMRIFFIPVLGIITFVLVDLFIKSVLLSNLDDVLQLILTILISILIYILVVMKFDRDIFKKLIKFIRS